VEGTGADTGFIHNRIRAAASLVGEALQLLLLRGSSARDLNVANACNAGCWVDM
jgi:hypothetical protein